MERLKRWKSNSLAGFCCLVGLAALIPAYFLPAFLMANAVDGPCWFSIWSGIHTFYQQGNYFLATLILAFSVIFPVIKLGLGFLATLQSPAMPERLRNRIMTVTGWTAKYSMLDVLVIAMLILIVKVDDYVRLIPTNGLYLFCFAIFCSVVANVSTNREPPSPSSSAGGLRAWLIVGLCALVAVAGGVLLSRSDAGLITSIEMRPLTKRPVSRTVERLKDVAGAYDGRKSLLSKNLMKRLAEAIQAASTDSGMRQELVLRLEKTDAEAVEASAGNVDLSNPEATAKWEFPEPVSLSEVKSLSLVGQVEYLGFLDSRLSEETLTVEADPFRKWTRTWHGRIFQFDLHGPPAVPRIAGAAMLVAGLAAGFWFLTRRICR